MVGNPDRDLVVALVASGSSEDAAASLENVGFADWTVALCADQAAEDAFREAGATTLLDSSITVDRLLGPRGTLPTELYERAAGKWLLVLRSDERVSVEFRDELSERIPRLRPEDGAVAVPLRRYLVGAYLEHGGWGATQPRLFWISRDADSGPCVLGDQGDDASGLPELVAPLIQLGDRSLSDAMRSLNATTDSEVLQAQRPEGKFCPGRLLVSTAKIFLSSFVVRRGFRDGVPGLVASVFAAVEQLVVSAKQFER